jgi:hypothetical protein
MNTFSPRVAFEQKLPKAMQPAITWLTGVPASDEILRPRSEVGRVTTAFATLWIGVALGMAVPFFGGAGAVALMLTAWIVAIGAARDLQLSVYHHCAHGNVISATASIWIGRVIATMLLIERFDSYAPKHTREHHGRNLVSTVVDATVQFLLCTLRIEPGAPDEVNRRRFLIGLVSPRVHAVMLADRFASQFGKGASWINRAASGGYWALLVGLAVASGSTAAFVIGVVLPLTIGYQTAQIARLMVEHRWMAESPADGRRTVAQHDDLTVAVRCAVLPPAKWTLAATVIWTGDMAFNAFIRWTVLPGDSGPAHHYHHARARGDWVNYIAASALWEAERLARGLPPSEEAWGYGAALNLTLASFATATTETIAAPPVRGRQLQEA